jgi:hypothetical protein
VTAAGTNAFVINTPGVHVVLRGLDINGAGTGLDGIRFLQGESLSIENCRIYGFAGQGIEISNTLSRIFVKDTVISGNAGGGILTAGEVRVVLDNVRIERNGNDGLRATGNSDVIVRNSVIAGNTGNGVVNAGSGLVTVDNSVSSSNGGAGIRTTTDSSVISIGNSTVVGNVVGIASTLGAIVSLGNNAVAGNSLGDGVADSTVPRI